MQWGFPVTKLIHLIVYWALEMIHANILRNIAVNLRNLDMDQKCEGKKGM